MLWRHLPGVCSKGLSPTLQTQNSWPAGSCIGPHSALAYSLCTACRFTPEPQTLTHGSLQALGTTIASNGMEACRRCCGGHGYSLSSGLPTLFASYVQNATWEVHSSCSRRLHACCLQSSCLHGSACAFTGTRWLKLIAVRLGLL